MLDSNNQTTERTFVDHDCVVASKLHNTCNKVQFLGVTATLFAFWAFIEANSNDPFFAGQSLHIVLYAIPIMLAYLSIANTIFLPDKIKNDPSALLWVCWTIFILDTCYLGVLVGITGGPDGSSFTPLFLLIPSAASCFCQPRGKPFWILIGVVIATYMSVSVLEYFKHLPTFEGQGDKTANLVLKSLFTVCCIATAAYCHKSTYSIRRGCKREEGIDPCKNLYL